MRKANFLLVLFIAALFAACGGDCGSNGQTSNTRFAVLVVFGDSLADVGTEAVGAVAAAGGGKYTINGDGTAANPALTGKTWPELIAAQLHVPAPCAAQTGLDGDPARGFAVPVVNHAGCYGYAQGGARVTNPVGIGNKLAGSPLGQLTVPVVTQVANHLALAGGSFKGDEMVFVTAGGSDAFALLDQLAAGANGASQAAADARFARTLAGLLADCACDRAHAEAVISAAIQAESARPGHTEASVVRAAVAAAARLPGNAAVADPAVYGPMVALARAEAAAAGVAAASRYAADNGPAAVYAMGVAGTQLAAIVREQIVGKGARTVVVNSLPDVAVTPAALALPAPIEPLVASMVAAFNDQLKAGVGAEAKVRYVDLYALTHDQALNPSLYGLTNIAAPACGHNFLGGSALLCNVGNLVAGDVSHYMFADTANPTPYQHWLMARYIAQHLAGKGWM